MRTLLIPLAGLFAIAGLLLLLPAFAHEGHDKVETQGFDLDAPRMVSHETAALIGLKTAEVDFGSVEAVVRVTGVVRPLPDRVQVIAPRIAGAIELVHVQEGERVQAGDALIDLASPDYLKLRAELVQAEGRASQFEVDVVARGERAEVAKVEYTRVSANAEAVNANLVSEKQTAEIEARAQAKRAELQLIQARAERDTLKQLLVTIAQGEAPSEGKLVLRALLDGVVTERRAVTGDGVAAGETLLRVADYKLVQVEAEVPESLLAGLSNSVGSKVRLRPNRENDPATEGVVRFVSPGIDPVKRTAHLIVEADNASGALREGMFVEAFVVLREEKSAVVVPGSAVLKDGPTAFVFIQDGDFFKKKDIVTGAWDDRVIEVVEGLAPGDVVIVAGGYSVSQMRPKATSKQQTSATPNAAKPADEGHGESR